MKGILKQVKKEIGYNIFTSIFTRVIVLILPIFWAEVITYATASNFDSAYVSVIKCTIVIVLYWFSEDINQVAIYKLYNKIYYNLTTKAINGICHNSLFSLSRFSLSEYLNILNSDIDIIASYYTNYIARVIRIIELFVIYYYFARVNIYMFLIAVVISGIGILAFMIARKKTANNNLERKQDLDQKTGYNHEFFAGIRDVKAFNLFVKISSRMFDGTSKYLKSNAKYNVQLNRDKFVITGFVEVFKYVLMIYGVYLISQGKMDIGTLVVIYNYYAKIVDNFSIVSVLNVEKCNLKVSINRYNKIFEYASNNDDALVKQHKFIGKIEFNNILYGYRDNPILKDATFTIKENSLVSVVGRDDSGYHGVYELLLKMNRQHVGTIKIDDISIKDIQNATYYNNIALVSPNPFFFNLSVKDNLLIVNKNYDEILNVCKKLKIDERIENLQKGYETIVNDDINLELRYMLAIARVLLKKTKIILIADLLFDLSKDDFDSVVKYLKEISKDHTIIVLGRELDLCSLSDQVIVFDKNEVREIGTHNELIKKKGFYYSNFYNVGNKEREN